MPQRIQLRRTKGWRMPPNTVKVDRSSRWGNPHHTFSSGDRMPRADAVEFFRTFLKQDGCVIFRGHVISVETARELRGKNLACWCPLSEPCHADVLLEIANR